MLKTASLGVLLRVFPASAGTRTDLSARFRPYWTDLSLCDRQFPPGHIEVGQGEQGEEMGRVLGKTPVPDLAIAPQVLDDAKGMCSTLARTRLLFRLNDRSAQLRRLPRLALRCTRHWTPSFSARCLRLSSA